MAPGQVVKSEGGISREEASESNQDSKHGHTVPRVCATLLFVVLKFVLLCPPDAIPDVKYSPGFGHSTGPSVLFQSAREAHADWLKAWRQVAWLEGFPVAKWARAGYLTRVNGLSVPPRLPTAGLLHLILGDEGLSGNKQKLPGMGGEVKGQSRQIRQGRQGRQDRQDRRGWRDGEGLVSSCARSQVQS